MTSAIEVNSLYFSYEEVAILENISFTLEPGAFVGIIGPNGGGKTTLLMLLMGFLRPKSGKISLFGSSPKVMQKKMGWVPQHFHFDKSFPISVMEVVLAGRLSHAPLFGRYSKEDEKAALEALDRVGMQKFKTSAFSSLSGGQAQRVLIARALAADPLFLFLDEPTASVDPHAEEEILAILRQLKGEKTILMVTHDLKTVASEVEKVFCLQRTLSELTPSQVCQHTTLGLYHPSEGRS